MQFWIDPQVCYNNNNDNNINNCNSNDNNNSNNNYNKLTIVNCWEVKQKLYLPSHRTKNSYNKYDVRRDCGEEEVIIIKQIIITIIITKFL